MSEFRYPQHSSFHKTPPSQHHETLKGKPDAKAPEMEIPPTGVLTIHIKRCKGLKISDIVPKSFAKRLPVNIYIQMSVGDITKMTAIVEVRCANHVGAVFDDLKHFSITINNKLEHESNKVKFALMGYQGGEKHRKLGEKEVHLFNLIRNKFIVETLEFTKNAHVIGETEMEMSFSYGCFGYGYSSQLESKTRTYTEQIAQSLFYRAEPPQDRKHESKDIMTNIPVPHPPFINWSVQVDLMTPGKEYMTDSVTALLGGKEKTAKDYPYLLAKMNKRMPEIQKKYAALTKRSQRLNFLQSLVSTKLNPELEEAQNGILYSDEEVLQKKKVSHVSVENVADNQAASDEGTHTPGLFSRAYSYFSRLIGPKTLKPQATDAGAEKGLDVDGVQQENPEKMAIPTIQFSPHDSPPDMMAQ